MQTSQAITWEQYEEIDADGRSRRAVRFVDAQGEQLASYEVPLDIFRAGREETFGAFKVAMVRGIMHGGRLLRFEHMGDQDGVVLVHRTVVARALIHGLRVPTDVLEGHDAALLAEMVVREERLHGPMPNQLCCLCSLLENIEEETR
jgi:hypothetical protein